MGLDSLISSAVWAEDYELTGDSSHTFKRLERQVMLREWDVDEFRKAFDEAERVRRQQVYRDQLTHATSDLRCSAAIDQLRT
jgi:acid stress-induced BolA-like protein IbaG/YrbA